MKDRKAPHGCKRDERAVERMRMEIRHRGWPRPFDQQNGPVSAAGESCDLREQPSIDQRYRDATAEHVVSRTFAGFEAFVAKLFTVKG